MKSPLAVRVQLRASREIEEIDEWWRGNRSAAPDMFLTELLRAFSIIALMPTLGTPARDESLGVRRLLLKRTHYYLYYRVCLAEVEILAVWHSARGTGPRV